MIEYLPVRDLKEQIKDLPDDDFVYVQTNRGKTRYINNVTRERAGVTKIQLHGWRDAK